MRRALAVAIGLAACARDNPAFDPDSGTESAADDGATTRPTSATDDGKPPTGDADGTATASATGTSGGTGAVASDDAMLPATDTGPSFCDYMPALTPFAVHVADENGADIDLPCGDVYELVGPLQSLVAGELSMLDCRACGACTGEVVTVSISDGELGKLPAPSVPLCVRVQIATAVDGDCAPEVLLVSEAVGTNSPPEIIVTNLRDPPLLRALVPPTPELQQDAECRDVVCEGDSVPGGHALAFDNGSPVEPGSTVIGIELHTFTSDIPASYDIRLRFGAIGGDCREHFGWSAVRVPG